MSFIAGGRGGRGPTTDLELLDEGDVGGGLEEGDVVVPDALHGPEPRPGATGKGPAMR